MRRIYPQLLTAALALALAACQSAEPLVKVETVTLPQSKYVGIPEKLTDPCPIAEGPLSKAPEVARQRKASLQTCNGKLQRIRELSDKAVQESEGK